MLDIKSLVKKFDKTKAINELNLKINENAIYGLLGENGAGKTTLMKILTGLLNFEKGEVFILGFDIKKNLYDIRRKIAYIPDNFGTYYNLTVYEYMDFFASSYGLKGLNARKRIYELIERVSLTHKLDFDVSSLSRGMQQRLSFARALLHNPEFLIMDEPTSGMDLGSRISFKEMLRQLGEEGKTILISSHNLNQLEDFCTDIGIIDKGKLLVNGSINDIIRNIELSNPIEVKILNGINVAMGIFKENPLVTSISLKDNTFLLGFSGDELEESKLLYDLISNEVPVVSFIREAGSLESFFMQMTKRDKEKVILKNDY